MAKRKAGKAKRNRRVLGSRQYADYSDEMLQLAAENVRTGKMSSYEAQKMFNIPRRTILNRARNKHTKTPGGQIKLKAEEEKQFVNVLIAAADFGSPLTELDLRIVAHEYLKKNNKEHLFEGKMPGPWWVKNFLDRHNSELTTRVTQNIKKVRAEKTENEFEEYFENLEKSLKDVPNSNVLNFDETNFSDNPGNIKCIFKRSVKYPERIMNSTKGSISVMFAVTANGDCLPPYTVYKAENMWNLWRLNGPRGSRYSCTKSGWFDSVTFQDWFETVVLQWAKDLQGPKVIIGDNLSSHVNVEIFKLCQEYNIRFVFLPPNATHLAQPLDVSFFAPLKKHWRKILTKYKIDYPQNSALNKADFPALLKTLMENIEFSKKEIVLSGFRATGIVPFNPAKVLRKLPTYEETIKYNVDETLLSYLKAQRTPKATEKRRRNQKISIPPGKSVEAQDIEEIIQQKNKKKKRMDIQQDSDTQNLSSQNTLNIDNLVMPSTSTNHDDLDMPSTSTSRNEPEKNEKKITVIQEKVLGNKELFNILKDVNKKQLKRKQVISNRFMDDSDTDVDDNFSLHDSEDSPIEDNGNTEEEKEEMEIHETYMGKTMTENTEKEKTEKYLDEPKTETDETKEIERINGEEIKIGSFLLVKFLTKKSTKFYIGEVMVIQEVGLTVKFLRKKKNNVFVWPIKDDVSFVLRNDIEIVLPPPQLLRRSMYKFKCEFDKYNVC